MCQRVCRFLIQKINQHLIDCLLFINWSIGESTATVVRTKWSLPRCQGERVRIRKCDVIIFKLVVVASFCCIHKLLIIKLIASNAFLVRTPITFTSLPSHTHTHTHTHEPEHTNALNIKQLNTHFLTSHQVQRIQRKYVLLLCGHPLLPVVDISYPTCLFKLPCLFVLLLNYFLYFCFFRSLLIVSFGLLNQICTAIVHSFYFSCARALSMNDRKERRNAVILLQYFFTIQFFVKSNLTVSRGTAKQKLHRKRRHTDTALQQTDRHTQTH
jgi:hypothetical protein